MIDIKRGRLMVRPIVHTACATLMSLAVVGCGVGNNLPEKEAASLIQVADAHHCDANTVFQNKSRSMMDMILDTDASRKIDGWVKSNVIASSNFRRVSSKSRGGSLGPITTTEYQPNDGWSLFYTTETANLPFGFTGSHTSLRLLEACPSKITDINIMDITFDKSNDKNATVVYTKIEEPTIVASELKSSPIAPLLDIDAISTHPAKQFQAQLRYLDKTGWQVVSSNSPL